MGKWDARLVSRPVAVAPKDTGRLRNSADPEVKVKNNKITATVTFSAKNPVNGYDYALIQHEVKFNHPNGGQWKYLKQPLDENRDRYKKFVADKIKEATTRGTNSRR